MQVGGSAAQGRRGFSDTLWFQGIPLRKLEAHAMHQSLSRHVPASHAVLAVVSLQCAVAGLGFVAGQTFSFKPAASQPSNNSSKRTAKKPRPLNSGVRRFALPASCKWVAVQLKAGMVSVARCGSRGNFCASLKLTRCIKASLAISWPVMPFRPW